MSMWRKGLISLFIVFNLLIMVRVHLSQNNSIIRNLYRPVDAYLSFFSIYQDWMMFAPDPGKYNSYITAEVEFFDGSQEIYKFPRNRDLTFIQKYKYGEKYRKFFTESFHESDKSFLWEDSAKFALRKLKDQSFAKIPMRVHLSNHWDLVPDMKESFRKHLSHQNTFKKYTFYSYEVIK